MDLNLFMERKSVKKVFNAYTIYVILAIVVFANLFLFPDLFNNRDIRINDMSFLIPNQQEIVSSPIQQVGENISVENNENSLGDSEVIIDNQNNQENVPIVHNDNEKESLNKENTSESKDSESNKSADDNNNSQIETKDSLVTADNNSSNSENLKNENNNLNETTSTPVSEVSENKEKGINSSNDSTEEKTKNNNTDTTNKNFEVVEDNTKSVVEKTNENTEADSSSTSSSPNNIENVESNSNDLTPTATIDTNTNTENNNDSNKEPNNTENTSTKSEKAEENKDNEPFLKATDEVISIDQNDSETQPSSEDPGREEIKTAARSYYLLILFVILSSLIAGFALFIHRNYNVFRQIYYSSKATYNIRDYLYNGYELLED